VRLCVSCSRRRIDGTDVRVSSRDRTVTSRKQVRGEVSVLCNLTSSCCQGRRRAAETRRPGTGRQLMSVWDSGTDCRHQQNRDGVLTTSFRALNSTAFVNERCDVVCCHHHHQHCHELCTQQQQQQQQEPSADNRQRCNTPISDLSVRQLPFECQCRRSKPPVTF